MYYHLQLPNEHSLIPKAPPPNMQPAFLVWGWNLRTRLYSASSALKDRLLQAENAFFPPSLTGQAGSGDGGSVHISSQL